MRLLLEALEPTAVCSAKHDGDRQLSGAEAMVFANSENRPILHLASRMTRG